jgi:hypothetical protein
MQARDSQQAAKALQDLCDGQTENDRKIAKVIRVDLAVL